MLVLSDDSSLITGEVGQLSVHIFSPSLLKSLLFTLLILHFLLLLF